MSEALQIPEGVARNGDRRRDLDRPQLPDRVQLIHGDPSPAEGAHVVRPDQALPTLHRGHRTGRPNKQVVGRVPGGRDVAMQHRCGGLRGAREEAESHRRDEQAEPGYERGKPARVEAPSRQPEHAYSTTRLRSSVTS